MYFVYAYNKNRNSPNELFLLCNKNFLIYMQLLKKSQQRGESE